MGNFEKLSVLVIAVIIVMILVVAVYTWSGKPDETAPAANSTIDTSSVIDDAPQPVDDLPVDPAPPAPPPPPAPAPSPVVTPEPAPAPAPAPVADTPTVKIHRVADGDTLGSIAKQHLGAASKWEEIVRANPGVDPYNLRKGMELKIPVGGAAIPSDSSSGATVADRSDGSPTPGGTYVVKSGETLETIAKKVYGTKTRWPDIWVANLAKLEDPNDLTRGMTITIPR